MNRIELKWLLSAGILAAGEGLAAVHSRGAATWPLFLGLAGLVALIGFGFRLRGWRGVVIFLLGMALSFHASLAREEMLRLSPWLRNHPASTLSSRPMVSSPRLERLRADLSRRVGLGLDAAREVVALNRAILLGERGEMSKATKEMFVASGTIHVFAISGLHVMMIARLFMFLFAFLFVPLRLQGLLTLPLVWGYVLLIGAPPSAVRAALMASVYFAAPVCSRRPNGLIAWALAFILVHLVNPAQIGDVGSQFSFAVMLALILAGRFGGALLRPRLATLFLTAMAWAAGVPIAAVVFERITPGGLLANLVLLVAAGYSVIAGALGALLSYVSPFLAIHCNNLSALMTDAMVLISRVVADLPGANFEVEAWKFETCVAWYAGMGLALYLIYHIRMRRNLI